MAYVGVPFIGIAIGHWALAITYVLYTVKVLSDYVYKS